MTYWIVNSGKYMVIYPNITGGVAEWFKAAVLKTAEANNLRGFESHPLRHFAWLAQLADALDLGSSSCGFDSHTMHKFG